jgi:hypothetical protein
MWAAMVMMVCMILVNAFAKIRGSGFNAYCVRAKSEVLGRQFERWYYFLAKWERGYIIVAAIMLG